MDLLAVIGFITIIYCLVYIICPWFLDCDLHLAIYEKFGKPTSNNYAYFSKKIFVICIIKISS